MITKEQLDVIRKSFGDMGHGKGELIVELCDEIEALMAKPSTPNPHANYLRNYSGIQHGNGVNQLMLDAANEIDRLTGLLKERDDAAEKLSAIRHSLCEYINSVDMSQCPLDVAGHVFQWVHEQVDKSQVAPDPVKPPDKCQWLKNALTNLWNTGCGSMHQMGRVDKCHYCGKEVEQ